MGQWFLRMRPIHFPLLLGHRGRLFKAKRQKILMFLGVADHINMIELLVSFSQTSQPHQANVPNLTQRSPSYRNGRRLPVKYMPQNECVGFRSNKRRSLHHN